MTWWEKLFSGFNTTKTEEYPPRIPIEPHLGLMKRTGELNSPKFLWWMEANGFSWNNDRVWWQKVWTSWRPTKKAIPPHQIWDRKVDRKYPDLVEVWETWVFDEDSEKWTYRIVDPDCLAHPGGGNSPGWIIWENPDQLEKL